MTFRVASLLILTLLCGVALGWMTRPGGSAPVQEKAVREMASQAPASSQTPFPVREGRGGTEGARKPGESRISLPMNTVAAIMKKDKFQFASFQNLGKAMNDAMTMLGVADRDRAEVVAAIEKGGQEILEEEKSHVKVGKAEPAVITLDLSGMREPVQRITAGIRDSLFASLPADVAQTLADSVNWKGYYFSQGSEEAVFTIQRNDEGELMATVALGNDSTGSSLSNGPYPDDGTPIPAGKAFYSDRWNGFLDGLTLVPVPPK
jgi:hypothetical protein